MGHETLPSFNDTEREEEMQKELSRVAIKLYSSKDDTNDDIDNKKIDYDLPDRTPEQRAYAKQLLSHIQTQMFNDSRQRLTNAELSLISANTDIYDFANYPEMKKVMTHSLIDKVNEAAEKDYTDYDEHDELFQIARLFEENQVTSDLLKEAIDNGAVLNRVGVSQIGDAIVDYDNPKSDSAIAKGLVRAERIGYEMFRWNGADSILHRGPAFQEALNLERGISPKETDILYDHLKYYLQRTNNNDMISELLIPSEDNKFAKLWLEDEYYLRNIFDRIPINDERYEMFDDQGNLTDKFSQYLVDNFSVDSFNDNMFIGRHPELFSSKELKDGLYRKIFSRSESFRLDGMEVMRDSAIKEFFKLASSESYNDNLATTWFASFISDHTTTDDGRGLYFTIKSPEDIAVIAEIAPMTVDWQSDGMFSHQSTNEKDKPWAKADCSGLTESCMALWQLQHPEDRNRLPDFFLKAESSERVDYAKEFPNFAETMRIFLFCKDDETKTDPLKDEVVNLCTNAIRNKDLFADKYQEFLFPTDDGSYHYWQRFADNRNDYYKHFTPEAIKQIPATITTLFTTGVEELARNHEIVADRVLSYSPEKAGQTIKNLESIYLRKDIPKFAKLYYSADLLFRDSLREDEYGIPPFLKWAKSAESGESINAREVLMTDLLKNAIHSNNSSLRAYLRSCMASKEELDTVSSDNETITTSQDDYIEEFTDNKKFRRRFFGYAKHLGFNNPEEILEEMDRYRDEKNLLHKNSVIFDEKGKAHYKRSFKSGDLIKGIGSEFLHLAIQDGFNCPEMAGIGAHEDVTHWDADFGSVNSANEGAMINDIINGSVARIFSHGLYAIVHREGLDAYDSTDENVGSYSRTPYEIYHRGYDEEFRGIRTGIGSEDIDAYVVESDNDSRRKALRLEYEMAKNGIYAPIIDRKTEEVIFTPDDFEKLRSRMGGLNERYETVPSEYYVSADLSLPDDLANNDELKYSNLVSGYLDRYMKGADYEGIIRALISNRIYFDKSFPKDIRDSFLDTTLPKQSHDHSALPIEIIATGSTARGTSLPNDADVDIVLRLNRDIFDNNKKAILEALTARHERWYNGERPVVAGGLLTSKGIRKGIVEVSTGKTDEYDQIEVDISPVVTTNQRSFFSEEAAEKRLKSPRRIGDTERIAANIVIAKALLKEARAYKTSRSPEQDGGLGGLGVENWILQSGGSLRQACEEFLMAADDGQGGYVSFDDFSSRYAVFDMGENHFGNNYESPYDNFVEQNMSESGYRRMCDVCKNILQHTNSPRL